jgi:glycosyltransferase involved in cell wall biosynthesis
VLTQLNDFPSGKLLVVDNGSQDETPSYLKDITDQHPNTRFVVEAQPGLYNARARAIQEASGDFILFIDDDAVPADNWVAGLLAEFAKDPSVGVIGAAIDPIWEGERPDWFSNRALREIPVMSFPHSPYVWHFPCYPPGVSLAIRSHPCMHLYSDPTRRTEQMLGFTEATKRSGTMVSGDDLDLVEIYAQNGFKIISVNHIRVGHRVTPSKLSPKWFIQKFESDGRMRVRMVRLAGYGAVSRHTLLTLAALPALFAIQPLRLIMRPALSTLAAAYYRKSVGAWQELLSGRRGVRYPYRLTAKSVDR